MDNAQFLIAIVIFLRGWDGGQASMVSIHHSLPVCTEQKKKNLNENKWEKYVNFYHGEAHIHIHTHWKMFLFYVCLLLHCTNFYPHRNHFYNPAHFSQIPSLQMLNHQQPCENYYVSHCLYGNTLSPSHVKWVKVKSKPLFLFAGLKLARNITITIFVGEGETR